MTTHELAKTLTQLAGILKAGPDIELREMKQLWTDPPVAPAKTLDTSEAALSIMGLLALSSISKADWRELIQQWGLPLTIPNTYSARDTIGKLLNYLSQNPQAQEKIRKQSEVKASPELMKALAVIMGGAKK